jgi:hypothetical protein
MKITNVLLKVILSLILILPIGGLLGIFPEPTADLYNTTQAFDFITMLNVAIYISYIMAGVHVLALYSLWTHREALAALLILPITVNVVGFHAFLDGGLLTGGAMLGNVMLLINVYLLWKSREKYQSLLLK